MKKQLKLTIELVPGTLWYQSLRSVVGNGVWSKITYRVCENALGKCEVCGRLVGTWDCKRLNCHELWEYDDLLHIQKLVGFIALCDLCHHAKHLGLLGTLVARDPVKYKGLREAVVSNFCAVNKCSRKAYESYYLESMLVFATRSQFKWTQDFSYLYSWMEAETAERLLVSKAQVARKAIKSLKESNPTKYAELFARAQAELKVVKEGRLSE